MAISQVTNNTKFSEWATITNAIITALGDLAGLSTDDKVSAVNAINELVTKIGSLTALSTDEKTSLVAALNEVVESISTVGQATSANTQSIGTLSSLSTSNKSSLVQALNELFGTVDSLGGDVDTIAEYAVGVSEIPLINEEANNGRFGDGTGRTAGSFTDTTRTLVPYNATLFVESDRFFDDNSDNGGAGSSLGGEMSDLLAALSTAGRTNLRNGYEFYIAEATMGAGTADPELYNSINYYPMVSTDDSMLGHINGVVTFQCWIRLKTLANAGDLGIVVGDTDIITYVNNVAVTEQSLITEVDGWVHLRQVYQLDTEFKQFFPAIFANTGDVVQFALPCLFRAEASGEVHVGVV